MTATSSTDTAAKPERFYTVREAALLLKVSALTVRRAIRAGDLAATRLRRQYRIPEEVIARMVTAALDAAPETSTAPADSPSQPLTGGIQ